MARLRPKRAGCKLKGMICSALDGRDTAQLQRLIMLSIAAQIHLDDCAQIVSKIVVREDRWLRALNY